MKPKPAHLGPRYAAQFLDERVARAYHTRPPYPAEVFEVLKYLADKQVLTVLDLGCGTGEIALNVIGWAERVDAVDSSREMLAIARSRPEAEGSCIRWVHSAAEEFEFEGPYGLVVASESLHWMDWQVVLTKIGASLSPGGQLALVVGRQFSGLPWQSELQSFIPEYSTNREYQPYDLVEELSERGLFAEQGRRVTSRVPYQQALDDYVESFHSRNGFSRERMGDSEASEFDARVRSTVLSYDSSGCVRGEVHASIVWGRPV